MKDAGGHGSDPRGAHSAGAQMVGRAAQFTNGVLFRGTASTAPALSVAPVGDLSKGVYLTPDARIAASYGGGPTASVKAGTRAVQSYEFNRPLDPKEVAIVFGGAHVGEDVRIHKGDGTLIYSGPWGAKQMEAALAPHSDIKAVFGDEKSIGVNQVAVRDPSILRRRA
jgi:hypothetical protein